jgi:hypothetical protein
MRNFVLTFGWILVVGLLGSCATMSGGQPASSSNCPPAGTQVPLTKAMNAAFIREYERCDIQVEAQFYKMGNEGFMLGKYDTNVNATFQVVEPGGGPQNNVGGSFGLFAGTPKASSDILFQLKPGDKVLLRGAPIGNFAYGQLVVAIFQAALVRRAP